MGKRGPKAQPTSVKKARGNPGRRPLNGDEPQYEAGLPEPPDHIQGEALAEWRRLGPELVARGLLSEADRAAFSAYCSAWGRWVEAEQALAQEELVIEGSHGARINPLHKVADSEYRKLAQMLARFGLSPSDRAGVRVEKPRSPAKPGGKGKVLSIMDGKAVGEN